VAVPLAKPAARLQPRVPSSCVANQNIPFPEFTRNQMASLIAYLHGGGPPPDVKMGDESMGGGEQMGGEPADENSGGQQMGGGKQGQHMGGE
jgi:hypothetical protein